LYDFIVSANLNQLQQWAGRSETQTEQVTAAPLAALNATLDREPWEPRSGDVVPPCWHWLYFLPLSRQSQLGVDGHPRRGEFLPPVPLPRRMWAGSRIEFLQPIYVGQSIARKSKIVSVSGKDGRSGPLVFVSVRHEISTAQGVAIVEDQDIVYREISQQRTAPTACQVAPADEQFSRKITPDPVLLFRYSALTFNGHRIHYDRPYAMTEEDYPGLVVHAPLIATLLIGELTCKHPQVRVTAFACKALNPLFDTAPFTVCGRRDSALATLWACGPQGLAMHATATLIEKKR